MQDLFIFVMMMTFLVFSVVLTMMPVYATEVLRGNSETAGYLQAASGLGALVAVLIVVPLAQTQKRSGLVLAAAAVWMGVWLLVFAFSNSLPLSLISMFLGSVGAPTIMTMALGLVQLMAPPDMRARLLSLFTMVSFGLQPFAAFLIGQSAEHFGVRTAIEINSLLLIIGALAMLLLRGDLRRWEVKAPQPKVMPSEAA
jgi:MFS family permease